MHPTALTPEQQERVRPALRELQTRYRTQKELARALGVAQQTISAVLGGTGHPGVYLASRIAELAHLSYEGLLSGQEAALRDRHAVVSSPEPSASASCAESGGCPNQHAFWEFL